MSHNDREETPELVPDDNDYLTELEDDLSDSILSEIDESLIEILEGEAEDLINSGDEAGLRRHYLRLLTMARRLSIDLDDIANEEIEELIQEQARRWPEERGSANVFVALPGTDVDLGMIDSGAECAICISNLQLGERATILPCGHMFHDVCITQWVTRNPSCPLCRQNITRNRPMRNGETDGSDGQQQERHVHWAV
ncbi:ring finger protein [Penicillium lividum]|nr:ring finger protein [Penicillium lividum]